MLVDLVRRPTGENLFLAPVRHAAELLAGDEAFERLAILPLRGDQVTLAVEQVAIQVRLDVARHGVHHLQHRRKNILER